MKRMIALWTMTLALLLMGAAELLPHHHHGGRVCFVLEFCEHDGCYNDEHTAHASHAGEAGRHGDEEECPLHRSFDFLADWRDGGNSDGTALHLLLLAAAPYGDAALLPVPRAAGCLRPHSPVPPLAFATCRSLSLRAPPACV